MASIHPHSDFILPGIHANGNDRWLVALAFAYSGQYNSRRIESHSYGIWNLVLSDLIFDLGPHTILIPQFTVGSAEKILPGPPRADDSFATSSEKDAKDYTPDFSVVWAQIALRKTKNSIPPATLPTEVELWKLVRISHAYMPLLVELKCPATRRAASVDIFITELYSQFLLAESQMDVQAEMAFLNQKSTERIILIVACGEWWRWKIATRDHYLDAEGDSFIAWSEARVIRAESEEQWEEEEEVQFPPRRREEVEPSSQHFGMNLRKGKRPDYQESDTESDTEWDKVPYRPNAPNDGSKKSPHLQDYPNLGGSNMEEKVVNIEVVARRSNVWSKCLRLGTGASNQIFYFIHLFLQQEDAKRKPPVNP